MPAARSTCGPPCRSRRPAAAARSRAAPGWDSFVRPRLRMPRRAIRPGLFAPVERLGSLTADRRQVFRVAAPLQERLELGEALLQFCSLGILVEPGKAR